MRGGRGGCAHWGANTAADPPAGNDRRDVLQSVDRRDRQGTPRARGRCAGWSDGPRGRRRGYPFQAAEPQQGTGGARAACPGRPEAVPAGDAAVVGGDAGADRAGRRSRGPGDRSGRPLGRRAVCRRHRGPVRRGGAHDGNLSARYDPYRRAAERGGTGRGGAFGRPGPHPVAAGAAAGSAQDRHAAATGPSHHRLGRVARRPRRRGAGTIQPADRADHQSAGGMPHHQDHAGDSRDHPRQPAPLGGLCRTYRGDRAALLPIDRGQDRAVLGPREPQHIPRTRGPGRRHRVSQRHLDQSAGRGTGCSAGDNTRVWNVPG